MIYRICLNSKNAPKSSITMENITIDQADYLLCDNCYEERYKEKPQRRYKNLIVQHADRDSVVLDNLFWCG